MDRESFLNLPNILTILRIGLTPIVMVLMFSDAWYWKALAFVVFAAAALTDYYDGRIARSTNRVSSFGRFLDPLADKILVTSALIAFVWGRMVHFWLVVPIIVRDIVITALRLHGIYHGKQLATSRLAKWKTAAQLFTVATILFCVGLEEVLSRFSWQETIPIDHQTIQILSNGLMAAVLLLTLLSGIHYLLRSNFIYDKP